MTLKALKSTGNRGNRAQIERSVEGYRVASDIFNAMADRLATATRSAATVDSELACPSAARTRLQSLRIRLIAWLAARAFLALSLALAIVVIPNFISVAISV
jgi:hypothetical protein